MKRRPHIATIKQSGTVLSGGELVERADPLQIDIKCRVQFVSNGYQLTSSGNKTTITAKVYTDLQPIEDAKEVIFNGHKYRVVSWLSKSNTSIIYIQ